MKPLIYIETSVISYLVARPSSSTIVAGHQAATHEFWLTLPDKFLPYISGLVVQEISQGHSEQVQMRLAAIRDFPILSVDKEVEQIAQLLLKGKAVPDKCQEDAVHIAVAAVSGMDLIATWNFKHINNPVMKGRMRTLLAEAGFALPEISSPDELLETGDE